MSYDVKAYQFAKIWLQAGGWTHEMDINRLAQLVQDVCQDFEADLANEYEEAQHEQQRSI